MNGEERKIPDSVMQQMYSNYRDEIGQMMEGFRKKGFDPQGNYQDVNPTMKDLDERYLRGDAPGGIVGYMSPGFSDKMVKQVNENLPFGGGKAVGVPAGYFDAKLPSKQELEEEYPVRSFLDTFFPQTEYGDPDTLRFDPMVLEDDYKNKSNSKYTKGDKADVTLAKLLIHEFGHGKQPLNIFEDYPSIVYSSGKGENDITYISRPKQGISHTEGQGTTQQDFDEVLSNLKIEGDIKGIRKGLKSVFGDKVAE